MSSMSVSPRPISPLNGQDGVENVASEIPGLKSGSKKRTISGSSDDGARQKVRRLANQPPRASQACRSCAASKVRCDDFLTCRRCQKKGVSCVRPAYWRGVDRTEAPLSIERRASERRLPSYDGSSSARTSGRGAASPLTLDSRLVGSTAPDANSCLNAHGQDLANFAPAHLKPVGTSMANTGSPQSILAGDALLSLGEVPYMDSIFEFPFLAPHELSSLAGFYSEPCEQAVDPLPESIGPHDPLQSPGGCQGGADALTLASLPCDETTISSEVVKAYDRALGNWRPRPRDYLAQDIASVSMPPQEQPSMLGHMGHFDPAVIPDHMSSVRRDEMVVIVSHCFATRQSPQVVPFFPSVEILDELLKIFLTSQRDQSTSFIHIPHFSIPSCDISLLMACIAAGAASSSNLTAHRFGLALVEALRQHLPAQAERENTLTRTTPYVQGLVILSDAALWSGDKRKSEISDIQSAFATTMLRHARRFDGSSYACIAPSPNQSDDTVTEIWRLWADQESIKRTAYQHFMQSTQRATVRNTPSEVSCTEVSMPIPERNQLWFARSAGEWKTLYLGLQAPPQSHRSTLVDCLANGLGSQPLPPQQDRELTLLLVAYSLLSLLVEDRRRSVVFNTDAQNDLASHILPGSSTARRVASLIDELRGEVSIDAPIPGSTATMFIFEFYNFYAMSPNHLTDQLLGNEKSISAHEASERLKEWRQSRQARVAVWHAGQLFRICRTTRPEERSNFHIYALFHAALCLWTHSYVDAMASADTIDTFQSTSAVDRPKIRLDGTETLRSQRWISHNHGTPYIAKSGDMIGATDQATELVPIAPDYNSVDSFMSPLLGVIETTFSHEATGRRFPILQPVCQVLQALSRFSRRRTKL